MTLFAYSRQPSAVSALQQGSMPTTLSTMSCSRGVIIISHYSLVSFGEAGKWPCGVISPQVSPLLKATHRPILKCLMIVVQNVSAVVQARAQLVDVV
jgi:hypothetical protein